MVAEAVALDHASVETIVAGWLEECREGKSDREPEAVALARACGLDVNSVQERFKVARTLRGGVLTTPAQAAMLAFQHSKTPSGIPASLENALIAIDKLEVDCKYDVFHNRIYFNGEPILGLDNVALRVRQMVLARFRFDPGQQFTYDALRIICLDRVFDPVLDYLAELQWDGVPRLDRWLTVYCGADETELNRAIGRKFLIAGVRRVRQPGCKFDHITVFESLAQGIGKSTMLLVLAGAENFSDAEIIGLKKQEQQEATQGVWIFEIPELQGMTKADVRHLKQFASRTVDSARPAYGHNRVDLARRCVFAGTTNETAYLRDTTGNRRIWPVRLHGVIRQGNLMMIDLAGIKRDRDQLWAEAAAAEASGEPLTIPESLWAVAAIEQQKRMEPNPWADKLSSVLTKRMEEKPLSGKFAAHTDDFGNPQWRVESEYILTEVLDIPLDRQTSNVAKNLVEAMRSLDWHHNERAMRIGKVTTRGYSRLVGDDLCDVMTWAWMRYQQKAKGWGVGD